jgi:cell division protein FtsB
MKKVRNFMLRIYHVKGLKYIVVVFLAVLFIGFLDENSVWKHLRNQQYIGELKDEIKEYEERYKHDKAQIRELDSNPKSIEKIARERYFMKADDEDIFVLSDDERLPSSILSNETTE